MICSKCGKKLPDNAVKCNKCGEIFREISKNNETEEFLKKEKLKAAEKAKKLREKGEKAGRNKKILKILIPCVSVVLIAAVLSTVLIIDKNKKKRAEDAKISPELLIEYTFEDVSKEDTLITLGDINISAEEYEFFYRQSFSNVQNNAMLEFKQFAGEKVGSEKYNENLLDDYYDEYFEEFSSIYPGVYDFKKPVSQQKSNAVDEDGKEMPWREYIRNDALKTLMGYRIKYAEAQKAGMTLTDDIRYQVYSHIEGLRGAIKGSGYQNLNQYLRILFGSACNEEFFKNELIREYTASKYDSVNSTKKMNSYSDKEIKEFYEKNRDRYDYIDLCLYEVMGENAKETAEKIAKAVKNVDSFSAAVKKYMGQDVDKSDLNKAPKPYVDGNYSEELGKWAYSANRKAGDKSVFKTLNGYTVAVVKTPVFTTDNSLSYREIVINKTDENGNALSGKKLSEAENLAEQTYSELKENGANEDGFTYCAIKKSQGSTGQSGGFVPFISGDSLDGEMKEWLTDSARKTGDMEFFETSSSFNIIYFIRNYGEYWNYAVRSKKASDSAADDYAAKEKLYAEKHNADDIESAEQQILKNIDEIYFNIQ